MTDFDSFISVENIVDDVVQATIENGKNLITLGIPFFDDAFRGISKTDVVLLGAGSGAGKSEAAFHIAFHNAGQGRKVLLFALEAERREVETRKLYKVISKMYFDDPDRDKSAYINYTDFYYGRLWPYLEKYLPAVEGKVHFPNLHILYSPTEYTLEEFARDVASYSDANLIVLDHFHYLALGDEPENKAFKSAIRNIRETVLRHNIPVILVAQLRKEDNSNSSYSSVMPTLSDFHGSSDLFKIATKGMMFASGEDLFESGDPLKRMTLVKVLKNRIDGSVKAYTGCMSFDFRTNSYDNGYRIGKLQWKRDDETKRNVEKFVNEIDPPRWAVNAKGVYRG